jgi:hypothetical protein
LSPVGLDGFDTANGPPEKLMLGFEGESVPLEGVVPASTDSVKTVAAHTANAINTNPRLENLICGLHLK